MEGRELDVTQIGIGDCVRLWI